MKRQYTILVTAMLLMSTSMQLKAQVNTGDSLALVDLYNKTNGPQWTHKTNWLSTNPVNTWYGITVTGNRVTTINLAVNKLAGNIPLSMGNCTQLQVLYLNGNLLTGTIPTQLGNCTQLLILDLFSNRLTGGIPAQFGNCSLLTEFALSNNYLTGSIPPQLGNCKQLSLIILNGNSLSGTIPAEFGNCTKLTQFILYANDLTGSIPAELGNCTRLKAIVLTGNQLTGPIPASVGNCTRLNFLYLDDNELSGSIPAQLGNCKVLEYIRFNNNDLSGIIPAPSQPLNSSIDIYINRFNFSSFEAIISKYPFLHYAPQKNIPIHQNVNAISVTAGGTLSNNTYKWYKNGLLIKTAKGDSLLTVTGAGQYNATVTNSIVTALTLQSDTLTITSPVSLAANTADKLTTYSLSLITISPNPAKDFLNICTGKSGYAVVNIYEENGKKVYSSALSVEGQQPFTINISKLTSGTYFMAISINGEIIREKFIKQ